eukprot:1511867-Rhodomonas_salina.1
MILIVKCTRARDFRTWRPDTGSGSSSHLMTTQLQFAYSGYSRLGIALYPGTATIITCVPRGTQFCKGSHWQGSHCQCGVRRCQL